MVIGAFSSIFCGISGYQAKYIGTQTTIFSMLMMAMMNAVFMLSWTPDHDQNYVIFIMAIVFSYTVGLATSQIRAVYGIFFPNNPSAYSALIVFETTGLVIGSTISVYFCTYVKVYSYMIIITLSIISYLGLEAKHRYLNENSKVTNF